MFIGIDLALRYTGAAVVEARGAEAPRVVSWSHFTCENNFGDRRRLVSMMVDWCASYGPRLVVIEDYVPGIGAYVATGTGELGGMLRDRLLTKGLSFLSVNPASMHSFAFAGLGIKRPQGLRSNAVKDYLAESARVRWSFDRDSIKKQLTLKSERQNILDAFLHAVIGAGVSGTLEGLNDGEQKALKRIMARGEGIVRGA